jgi:hypothetical protein
VLFRLACPNTTGRPAAPDEIGKLALQAGLV